MQADIASGWNLTAPCDMQAVRRLAEKIFHPTHQKKIARHAGLKAPLKK
jgi:hypothetical protein